MNKVLYSRKSDEWETPKEIYNKFIENEYFDPCPINHKKDGLKIKWKEKNFVNPPYSKIKKWVEKAIKENKKGKEVVLLIPARTDTKYFRSLVDYGADFIFITGRLKFSNKNYAPFPSVYVILTGKQSKAIWSDRND